MRYTPPRTAATLVAFVVLTMPAAGRPDLSELPGYERYEQVQRGLRTLGRSGTIQRVRWTDDGRLLFTRAGERMVVDLTTLELRTAPDGDEAEDDAGAPRQRSRRPARGRQRDREPSPDEAWTAVCRDWNVVIENGDGEVEHRVTTQGTRKHRYGKASWVYGEELDQNTAMWWSPDSRYLAFYEFDERQVEDFYLLDGLSGLRTGPLIEGYPKPGEPNPIARLHVYDLQTRRTIPVETGSTEGTGHYVYQVRFAPDGRHLLFNRTNRWQNHLEVMAADVETGRSRVVVEERQESWQENHPEMRFLEDGQRFIWETERQGFRQLELRDLSGGRLASLTPSDSPIQRLIEVDEDRGLLFYTAFSGAHPLNAHLHRVSLDGSGSTRLTRRPLNHAPTLSPDNAWFIDRAETITEAPVTTLHDARDGRLVLTLAEPDDDPLAEMGLKPGELFTFDADDGETTLYGVLYKPSGFDPTRQYPLVVDVYGGPFSQRVTNRYRPVEALCELGFLVTRIDNRGTINRGKAFESASYLRLGTVDLADQAAGVRHLAKRAYVDGNRVGIFGSSYGGYMSALAVLKHPDVFHVAVAGSAVTDWRQYDTIYTERYMRTPEANPDGYEQGSCLTFADDLRGQLLIQHGMVDDNVHPTNAFQLIDRLDREDRPFEMRLYPDRGHGLGGRGREHAIAFLHEHLIGARTTDARREHEAGAEAEAPGLPRPWLVW